MNWFEKLMPTKVGNTQKKSAVPEGVWIKCQGCEAVLYHEELKRNLQVCPKCGHHHRVNARERLDILLDNSSREEIGTYIKPMDILKFKDSKRYKDRIIAAQKQSAENDALIVMQGNIKSLPVVAAAFEFSFIGGSMGSVVGEKFVRGVQRSIDKHIPFICITASGGARMQEGLFSLMQMAKTSAALTRLADRGIPYIAILTDPTTGGVSASLAMLGDLNIAEPNALIGFAGSRVIEQTVRQKLPEGFQRSEFLLQHGVIDMIVNRREMRDTLHSILGIFQQQPRLPAPTV